MCLADLFYRCSRSNHGREKSHSGEIRQETGEQREMCIRDRLLQLLFVLVAIMVGARLGGIGLGVMGGVGLSLIHISVFNPW